MKKIVFFALTLILGCCLCACELDVLGSSGQVGASDPLLSNTVPIMSSTPAADDIVGTTNQLPSDTVPTVPSTTEDIECHHDYEMTGVLGEPCMGDGRWVYTCKVCGNQKTETVIEHDVVEQKGYEATCTTSGLTYGAYCKVCGEVFEIQTEIPEKGHDYSGGSCKEPGICIHCGVVGLTPEHSWIAATCAEAKTCAICGKIDGEPLQHKWQEATCKRPKRCQRCKLTEGEPVPHSWSDATCTSPKKCQFCGITDGYEAHSYVDGICSMCGIAVHSEGLEYRLENGTYTVVSKGSCQDIDIIIPEKYQGIPVTAIGSSAFYYDKSIRSITIPASIQKIGHYAFASCGELDAVYYIGDITAWCSIDFVDTTANPLVNDCKLYLNGVLLTDLKMPDDVTNIAKYAFAGCTSLESVTISNGVTTIEQRAFFGCTNLKNITIPNSVTSIGEEAFFECTSLKSITIPDSITCIEEKTFFRCAALVEIVWSKNLTEIQDYTFAGCGFTSIVIPEGVVHIGEHAFSECSSLNSVSIPRSIKTVGREIFHDSRNLKKMYICDLVAWLEIANGMFRPFFYGAELYLNGELVTELVIPDGVTSIGENCFMGYQSLTSVIIPEGVVYIGKDAFSSCKNLTRVTLPDSLVSIGDFAFSWCEGIDSISIPEGVTHIGTAAFQACSSLTTLTLPETLRSIGDYAFGSCESLTTVVIPKDVTYIGAKVFQFSENLVSIYFNGSMEEWENIDKEQNWDYRTGNYTIHCIDGDISK